MFDQLWKTVQNQGKEGPGAGGVLGRAVSAGEGTFSLGAKLGAKPLTSAIGSDLPTTVKSAKSSEKLRELSTTRVEESWEKLQEELAVQRLVWESLVLSRGKQKNAKIPAIEASFGRVFQAKESGDTNKALELLQDLLNSTDSQEDLLSQSMMKACKNTIKQDILMPTRAQLAERLDLAGIAATLPRTDADKKEVERLVESCELQEDKLERAIRQVLLLPMPERLMTLRQREVKRNSEACFVPVDVSASRTLAEITGGSRMGAPVSVTGSKMSVLSGTSKQMAVTNPGNSLGAIARATDSVRSTTSTSGLAAPGAVAGKVRTMAAESPGAAWKKFMDEFSVQAMVWQSVSLGMTDPAVKAQFATDTITVKSNIDEILMLQRTNPERALGALSYLIDKMSKDKPDKNVLNNATWYAAQDVITQHELAPLRLELAERLDVATVPATLPRTAEEKAELSKTVDKCDLGDAKLSRAVHQMLLLPLPAGMAPVARRTSSKMQEVALSTSHMYTMSSMTTDAVKAKPKKTPSRTPSRPYAPPYAPPPRIMESI